MKTIDRIILGFIAVGLWTSIFMFNTHPRDAYAISIDASDIDGLTYYIEDVVEDISIDASDIDGLRYYIRRVVENCTVSGDVYVYDGENGEISSATISC